MRSIPPRSVAGRIAQIACARTSLMTIFTTPSTAASIAAIDEIIDGDTLHVGCVMTGTLHAGDWFAGTGYRNLVIKDKSQAGQDSVASLEAWAAT